MKPDCPAWVFARVQSWLTSTVSSRSLCEQRPRGAFGQEATFVLINSTVGSSAATDKPGLLPPRYISTLPVFDHRRWQSLTGQKRMFSGDRIFF